MAGRFETSREAGSCRRGGGRRRQGALRTAVLLLCLPVLSLAGAGCRQGPSATATPPATATPGGPSASPSITPGPTEGPLDDPDPALQAFSPGPDDLALLEAELRGCFDFFYGTANADPDSPGYGLIPDRMPSGPGICSIASVGYGLAALCIGDVRGFAPREDLAARALGTLRTLAALPGRQNGFFFHFLDMKTGRRAWNSELSVIDTAICINGVLMAGAHFGGEIAQAAEAVARQVEWDWYVDPGTSRFYMGYTPEDGFFGSWDMTAEQLMLYVLGAGSPDHAADPGLFYRFGRPKGYYGSLPDMIRSPAGSLFVYQFSHAWYDFRMTRDALGVDWFRNSVIATLANRQYAADQAGRLGGSLLDWGYTACDGPDGYDGSYGAPPRARAGKEDGTVAPYGAAGSMPFVPRASVEALRHMKEAIPGLWGTWGFQDAYNPARNPVWVARDVIGIDKGVSMLMVENYLTGFVWDTMGSIPWVQAGLARSRVLPSFERRLSSFEEPGAEGLAGVTAAGCAAAPIRDTAASGYGSLEVTLAAGTEAVLSFAVPPPLPDAAGQASRFRFFLEAGGGTDIVLLGVRFLDGSGTAIQEIPGAGLSRKPLAGKAGWDECTGAMPDGSGGALSRIAAAEIRIEGAGVIRLDDVGFLDPTPRLHTVLLDGGRRAGDRLQVTWHAWSPDGTPVLVDSAAWLSSDSPSGPWVPVEGAEGLAYELRDGDAGRFVACRLIGRALVDGKEIRLAPVLSEPSRTIQARP